MRNSILTVIMAASLAVGLSLQAQANFINNGGFETGDYTGWTLSGNTSGLFVRTSGQPGGYDPNSGTFFAAGGPAGSLGFISQTFSDTAGQDLQISYYFASNGTTPNEFEVLYNAAVLFDQSDIPATGVSSPWPYVNHTFNVTATGSDTLEFGFRDDPSVLALDDVSVNPLSTVPEPFSFLMVSTGLASLGLIRLAQARRKALFNPYARRPSFG
jgi:hypothetical protein